MFSFFKRLFNFQKTDTNPVKEEHQVKLETSSALFRLEDVKIEDTGSDNSFCLEKNNESHQKVELSKHSNFYSEEIAPSSSESKNSPDSFENQINTYQTICKSQRRCSKLATKKIAKVVEELSLQSDDNDNAVDECTEQESSKKPKSMNKQDKFLKKNIRFCNQCKTSKTVFGDLTKQKNCNTCGCVLYYSCTKCKEKSYATYKGWNHHKNICNGKSTSQKLVNVGNKSTLDQCSLIAEGIEKTCVKKAIAVKPKKGGKWQKCIRRYCQKCQKSVLEKTLNKKIECPTCSTLLIFECIKCNVKYSSVSGLYHHFKTQCFSNNQSTKKIQSTDKRLLSSTQHIQKTYFKCDMCTYQSNFKPNLIRHINAIHMQIQWCCKQCSFTTLNRYRLSRHEQLQHSSKWFL